MKEYKSPYKHYTLNQRPPQFPSQNPFSQDKPNELINRITSRNVADLKILEKSNDYDPSNDLTKSPIKLLNMIYHKKQEVQKGFNVSQATKHFLQMKVLNNEPSNKNNLQTRHIRSVSMKKDPILEERKSQLNSRETTPKINKNNNSISSTQKTKEMEKVYKKNSFHEKANLDETERKDKMKNFEKVKESSNSNKFAEKIDFKIFSKNLEKSIIEKEKLELQKKNEEKEKQIQRIIKKQREDPEGKIHDEMKMPKNSNFEPFINLLNLKNLNEKMHQQIEKLGGKSQNSFSIFSKHHFNFLYVIGKGGFGKVWKVEFKKNKVNFAMKEMSKSKIITKRSVNSVMNERHLLSSLKHDFLINMNFAFQDRDNLYLVMDLMNGGDLRFHIGRLRRFSEDQTKFFVACVVVGLDYLHSNSVIHRDIKPENLVLDNKGYVHITDMGIARTLKPENSSDTSGTPGYMAPEVMCRQNHGFAVDYFALGVIAYEFMIGRRPYLGRSRKEIRDAVLSKQVQIRKHEIPELWSYEAADFINKMIQRKPNNRLGINGAMEVRMHPWLKNFPWEKLLKREFPAPFLPSTKEDNFDYKQQLSLDGQDTNEDLIQQNAILLRRNSVQNLFSGYDFDKNRSTNSENSSALIGGKTTMNTTLGSFHNN